MPHCLKHSSRQCRWVCCSPVPSSCSFEEKPCGRCCNYSAEDAWWWSFSPMSAKHFTCFLGCIGETSIVLVTTSIWVVLFWDLRCFLWGMCYKRAVSDCNRWGLLRPGRWTTARWCFGGAVPETHLSDQTVM